MILTIKRLRATINIPKQVQEKKKIRWEFNKKKKNGQREMPDRTNKHGCVYLGAWCKLSAGGLPTYIQIQGNQKKISKL